MEHGMGLIERTPCKNQYQTGRATNLKRENSIQNII
jgi:hypothetical protein